MKKYEIEKDKVLNMWVIWKSKTPNFKEIVFKAKYKKECKEQLKDYE